MKVARCVAATILGLACGAPASAQTSTGSATPAAAATREEPRPTRFVLRFPQDGRVTQGWTIRTWGDIKDPPRYETIWDVKDGILYGGKSPTGRWVGTWLLSEQEYEDFVPRVHALPDGRREPAHRRDLCAAAAEAGLQPRRVESLPHRRAGAVAHGVAQRGRIGFQDLSNPGEQLLFRNPRIAVLERP